MKYFFGFILLVHAFVHIMGLLKAFGVGNVTQISTPVSKVTGIFWLLAALLFIVVLGLYMISREAWSVVALAAIVISQSLIITVWKDARYGTVINFIILLIAIPAIGNVLFNREVEKEVKNLFSRTSDVPGDLNSAENILKLPLPVQKWMRFSGVEGKPPLITVHTHQTGRMRTTPSGKWMPFTAQQYFNVSEPMFVWNAHVKYYQPGYLNGLDLFKNGEGSMNIRLLSLIDVVDERNNEKINSGTMLRFLGEICWFPEAALHDYITWEPIDTYTAQATFNYRGVTSSNVRGFFRFAPSGALSSYEAERYYGSGMDARLEKWVVEIDEYQNYNGYRLPSKCKVVWKLKEGDFHWLDLEITDWDPEIPSIYFQN